MKKCTGMKNVTKIVIEEAESNINTGVKENVFTTFAEAEAFCKRIGDSDREFIKLHDIGDGGYVKTDFEVHFEDGEIYGGRLDIKGKMDGSYDDVSIPEHIADFCRFYGGYMTDEDLQKYPHIKTREVYNSCIQYVTEEETKFYQNIYERCIF